jgi:hypothetical protein
MVLSHTPFNMVMAKVTRKLTEEQDSKLPKIMVYTDDTVIWEPQKSILEKKYQKTVTLCEYFRKS